MPTVLTHTHTHTHTRTETGTAFDLSVLLAQSAELETYTLQPTSGTVNSVAATTDLVLVTSFIALCHDN